MRYLITKVIYVVFVLAELFLALRLILKLFGANAANGFVSWVYETSGAILDPFRGIFPTEVFESTYVLEFSTLFAMIMYAIITMLLIYVVELIARPVERSQRKK
ncbi:MAG TPA: YggT family protein [Candidatus Saccharimonadaceae bacterium]|nr:YggT family protein [Candidatus Saccharimonadaceae bacterium]